MIGRLLLGGCGVWLGLLLLGSGYALSQDLPRKFSQNPVYVAAASPSIEELQQQQQQIDQQRSGIQQQQTQLQTQERSAQEQLGGLKTHIQATSAQITDNEKKLEAANKTLQKLQRDLAAAEAKYQEKQFATVARLRYLQRQKNSKGWAVLLQSKNLNEFLDRRYQLHRVYQADREFLAALRRDADALDQQRQGVEQQKNEISLITQELQAQKSEYEAQAQTQQSLIQRLKQDRQALEAAEAQLAKDSDSIAVLIQKRQVEQGMRFAPKGSGAMGYPSDGVITSDFGYRVHPILGYARFHDGVDFGADYGSPIWAAKDGVVIFAGWYGGYGQAVIIDHGNNVTTLYGHTSEIYVSEGETVRRGQIIAAVGSTGLSTGPHLHFEVRLSGEPTNPMNYL